MPELPEVETVRRTLIPHLIGRTLASATVHRRDVVATPRDPRSGFSRARTTRSIRPARLLKTDLLASDVVVDLVRRGKQLAIVGASGRTLCVHLGMSGQLFFRPRGGSPPSAAHIHLVWRLEDGGRLFFRDPRRFGGVWTFPSLDELLRLRWRDLGPDALTIDALELLPRLQRARRPIKAALLDQRVLAGVGNIYADEALFRARIHPAALASDLSPERVTDLAAAARSVLAEAVASRGSTLRDYVDANGEAGGHQFAHLVYGRAGLPCTACGRPLEGSVLAQRTTVWCPSCQSTKR